MNTTTRRDVAYRTTAFSLAAVMTLAILQSINLLAVEPAPDSLLAQRQAPVALAAAPASASPRS